MEVKMKKIWSILATEEILDIESITAHPNFNEHTYDNDIALLRLKQEVTYNHHVKPICLKQQSGSFSLGMDCYVAGWGHTSEDGEISPNLLDAKVYLISWN